MVEWLRRMRVGMFVHSFSSQGSDERRNASSEVFFEQALACFGYQGEPITQADEKGRVLARLLVEQHGLLVLDGLEPLQHPMQHAGRGRLKDPGVARLLLSLANVPPEEGRGLCLITQRCGCSASSTAPYQPEGIEGLQPLYQAVAHGCLARLYREALSDVYRDRILRGSEVYSVHALGAIGADLGALACFFETPWMILSPHIPPAAQAWLLNEAAYRLQASGRLAEAVEPMRSGLARRVAGEDRRTRNARPGSAQRPRRPET